MNNHLNYQATKAAIPFHGDKNSFVKLFEGPVNCGKSVANCIESFGNGMAQFVGNDGIKRTRVGVIRNTYPELKSTTIKTWQRWFPEHVYGRIKWDSPITHHIRLAGVDLEVIFLALDSEKDISKLMSMEFSFIYINELQFIHPKIFEKCLERVNRYPDPALGENRWSGIIADTNPPSTRHWIYKLFEKNLPTNFALYKAEPGVLVCDKTPAEPYATSLDGTIYRINPAADYVKYQGKNYYLNQIPSKYDNEIKVSIMGEYGLFISGKAIHPEYKDKIHYSNKVLPYNPNIELGLGWDFGLTPACAIVQFTPEGQFQVIGELYSEDSGLHDFAENTVIPYLNRHCPGWQNNYISRHDPAGQTGVQTDAKNCQKILGDLGIYSKPAAENNNPTPRREGLKYHLRRLINGEPGFILSSIIQQIREGLMGHFQYGKIHSQEGLDSRYHEKPLKNSHSHICEALEYIAMYYNNSFMREVVKEDKAAKEIAAYYHRIGEMQRKALCASINK